MHTKYSNDTYPIVNYKLELVKKRVEVAWPWDVKRNVWFCEYEGRREGGNNGPKQSGVGVHSPL